MDRFYSRSKRIIKNDHILDNTVFRRQLSQYEADTTTADAY